MITWMTSPRSHGVKQTGLDPWSIHSRLSELMDEQEPYQPFNTVYSCRVVMARLWHTSGEKSSL